MMTPDSRPIGVLTAEILATASHWCLLQDGNASVIQTECLGLDTVGLFAIVVSDNSIVPKGTRIRVGFFSATCYPCTLQPNGLVVPEPWPALDGEEEIEEWRTFAATWRNQVELTRTLQFAEAGPVMGWTLQVPDEYNDVTAESPHAARPDMHPAPRKGKAGIVWVWEKDRC